MNCFHTNVYLKCEGCEERFPRLATATVCLEQHVTPAVQRVLRAAEALYDEPGRRGAAGTDLDEAVRELRAEKGKPDG